MEKIFLLLLMIHGQPNGMSKLSAITQLRNWTEGCVALANAQMMNL
jgi:murein L,D-transpeptidase YafK